MPTAIVDGQNVTWKKGPLHRVVPAQSFTYEGQSFQLAVRYQTITVRGEWWPNGRTTFARGYTRLKEPPFLENDERAEKLRQRIVDSEDAHKKKRAELRASLEESSTPSDQPASMSRPRRTNTSGSTSGSPRKLSPSAPARKSPAKRAASRLAEQQPFCGAALRSASNGPPHVPAAALNAWGSCQQQQCGSSSLLSAAAGISDEEYPSLGWRPRSPVPADPSNSARGAGAVVYAIAAITIAPRADGRHSSMGGSLEVSQRANLASSLRPTRLH